MKIFDIILAITIFLMVGLAFNEVFKAQVEEAKPNDINVSKIIACKLWDNDPAPVNISLPENVCNGTRCNKYQTFRGQSPYENIHFTIKNESLNNRLTLKIFANGVLEVLTPERITWGKKDDQAPGITTPLP